MINKSREIEFRGLTTKKEWVYGSLVFAKYGLNCIYETPKAWIIQSAFSNGGWFNLRRKDFVKIETVGQYAGMKDKNGVKIYEGDIVKVENHHPVSETEYVFIGVVKFNDGSFIVDDGDENCVYLFQENSEWEVIGNIFENSLL